VVLLRWQGIAQRLVVLRWLRSTQRVEEVVLLRTLLKVFGEKEGELRLQVSTM